MLGVISVLCVRVDSFFRLAVSSVRLLVVLLVILRRHRSLASLSRVVLLPVSLDLGFRPVVVCVRVDVRVVLRRLAYHEL